MTKKKIVLLSNAKINLGLYITGKRSDGFHNIETLYIPVTLSDKIAIEENENIVVTTNNADIPVDERNTVVKAALLLKEKCNIKCGCRIHIEKNIPQGAGLGGGSSNGAFVLKGLNDLWHLGIKESDLSELALLIGSDVPFFILNKPALGQGRGEILKGITLNLKYKILLIYPKIIINTGKVYDQVKIDLTKIEKSVTFFTNLLSLIETGSFEELENQLEPIVFREYPQLQKIKDNLYKDGAVFSSLSGSGSTIFGLFRADFDLEKIKRKYSKTNQVFEVKPITK